MPVDLFYAHGLRQGSSTLGASAFDIHQDTEDFPFIEYTIVVKLTRDLLGEPPSRMRVCGAARYFAYGPDVGAAGCFASRLHHASVAQESDREHLKLVYFFCTMNNGATAASAAATAAASAAVTTSAAAAATAAATAKATTSPSTAISTNVGRRLLASRRATGSTVRRGLTALTGRASHTGGAGGTNLTSMSGPRMSARTDPPTTARCTASLTTCKCGATLTCATVAPEDTIACDGGCGYNIGKNEECLSCVECDFDLCQPCLLEVGRKRARHEKENGAIQLLRVSCEQ